MKIRPKNWREFQHYKDRSPPWIRLHRKLLDDREFHQLPVESRALAPMLWLLAAETVDGAIHGEPAELAFRLRCSEKEIGKALKPLLDRGFFAEVDDAAEIDEELSPSQAMAQANGYGTRHIPDSVKREVWARDGGICCTCSATENIEYDHKVPVSKGGTSDAENVQLLCRTCNRKKRAKTAEQLATPAQPDSGQSYSEAEAEAEAEGATRQPSDHSPKKSPRARAFPEDLLLSEVMRSQALTKFPDCDPAEMFVAFRAHHEGKGSVMKSWSAAWTMWLSNAVKFGYPKLNGGRSERGLPRINLS